MLFNVRTVRERWVDWIAIIAQGSQFSTETTPALHEYVGISNFSEAYSSLFEVFVGILLIAFSFPNVSFFLF